MKTITLTNGRQCFVDDDDYERLAQYIWYESTGYSATYIGRRTVHMHKVLLQPPNNMEADHIDGDGMNNQRGNLRIATKSQNGANRRKTTNKSLASTKECVGIVTISSGARR